MIHLTCTNCHATLEIDDAFAGGVCRCQHCGTIQTVPAHMKGNAAAAATTATAETIAPRPHQQKSLYQKKGRAQEQSQQTGRGGATGLDELSEAVASSGLGRGSLQKPGAVAPAAAAAAAGNLEYATPPQQKKSPTLWIILGAVTAGLLLLLALAFFSIGRPVSSPSVRVYPINPGTGTVITPTPSPSPSGGGDGDVVIPGAAHFCGVDLSHATSVVYVLDRGSASADMLDTLKAATYASLETLGPRRKFAIIFWQAGSEPIVSFPQQGMIDASPGNIADATKALEDVVAQGRSDPATAIDNAAARNPSDVVFVTAKGDQLGDELATQIGTALSGKRVHTVAIGEEPGALLNAIAKQQNGTYQFLSKRQLDTFSRGK